MLKLAVIGKDVSKSTSPQIHKFIAGELGFDISYEKISVPEAEFETGVGALLKEYDGLNVTIPYKLSIIPFLKEVKGDALAFGAVNTVVTKSLAGYNTDGLGFMQMLESNAVTVKGEKVLLLGAGGAGRSVAKKLADAGAYVEIYDKNASNARAVEEEFLGVKAVGEVISKPRKLIINATGVGMHKTEGISPVTAEILSGCEVACDLIYEPQKSEFLRIAEDLGKKIINGRAMLFYQAYYSDCYYFGLTPSPELAAKLFEKYLKEIVK
ncbi:MAG: shikimate dehydrogenase [Clostridiales bacterium]|nr:shikimate dehydrogenase [Clostridiales bacterium]